MNGMECPREQEILESIASNRWPHRLSEDLHQHVETCAACKDLGLVAEILRADFAEAMEAANVPSPGLVWWRAQIRARQDSLIAANRPITIAHYIGVGLAAVTTIALLVLADFQFSDFIPDSLSAPLLLATGGGLIAFASAALYFVFSDR
jgi:hypothetical protein